MIEKLYKKAISMKKNIKHNSTKKIGLGMLNSKSHFPIC